MPSTEIASVALGDLAMTSERVPCKERKMSPKYLNEIGRGNKKLI